MELTSSKFTGEEIRNCWDERKDHHFFHNIKWREVIPYVQ